MNEMEVVWGAILRRVKELCPPGVRGKQSEVARACGVHRGTVSKWIAGERGGEKTSFDAILKYLRGLGLSLYEVLGDTDYRESDFDYIPKVKAVLGAGASLETNGDIKQSYAFRKEFIRHIGPARELALFDVQGESMQPTLHDGDTVLIDQGDKRVVDGNLYAIRVDDELMVKRLQRMPGKLLARSDNRDYGDIEIPINKGAQTNVGLIGRVRWIGRVV